MSSSLGTQERPVVTARIDLAGQPKDARSNVTDGQERSTRVLIGRRELSGFHVVVGDER